MDLCRYADRSGKGHSKDDWEDDLEWEDGWKLQNHRNEGTMRFYVAICQEEMLFHKFLLYCWGWKF
jgi:hypothetical protein